MLDRNEFESDDLDINMDQLLVGLISEFISSTVEANSTEILAIAEQNGLSKSDFQKEISPDEMGKYDNLCAEIVRRFFSDDHDTPVRIRNTALRFEANQKIVDAISNYINK